ncbi:MAG: hypothetical protein IPL65_17220 [Lewinellaceae bacterium]|nr:hypothetical protein [Lewinellaceae bacterium]
MLLPVLALLFAASCNQKPEENKTAAAPVEEKVLLDTFADLQILKYDLPGWDKLSLRQKS